MMLRISDVKKTIEKYDQDKGMFRVSYLSDQTDIRKLRIFLLRVTVADKDVDRDLTFQEAYEVVSILLNVEVEDKSASKRSFDKLEESHGDLIRAAKALQDAGLFKDINKFYLIYEHGAKQGLLKEVTALLMSLQEIYTSSTGIDDLLYPNYKDTFYNVKILLLLHGAKNDLLKNISNELRGKLLVIGQYPKAHMQLEKSLRILNENGYLNEHCYRVFFHIKDWHMSRLVSGDALEYLQKAKLLDQLFSNNSAFDKTRNKFGGWAWKNEKLFHLIFMLGKNGVLTEDGLNLCRSFNIEEAVYVITSIMKHGNYLHYGDVSATYQLVAFMNSQTFLAKAYIQATNLSGMKFLERWIQLLPQTHDIAHNFLKLCNSAVELGKLKSILKRMSKFGEITQVAFDSACRYAGFLEEQDTQLQTISDSSVVSDQSDGFDKLPEEMWSNIFSFFVSNEMLKPVRGVCKKFLRITGSPTLNHLTPDYQYTGKGSVTSSFSPQQDQRFHRIKISPDGELMAITTQCGKIQLWDIDGKFICMLDAPAQVGGIVDRLFSFTDDGRYLVYLYKKMNSKEGLVYIWDVKKHDLAYMHSLDGLAERENQQLVCAKDFFVVSNFDNKRIAMVFDIKTGNTLRTIFAPREKIPVVIPGDRTGLSGRIPEPNKLTAMTLSADRTKLVIIARDNAMERDSTFFYDLTSENDPISVNQSFYSEKGIYQIHISKNNKMLFVETGDEIKVIAIDKEHGLKKRWDHAYGGRFFVSENERYFFHHRKGDYLVFIENIFSEKVLGSIRQDQEEYKDFVFSPRQDKIVTIQKDGNSATVTTFVALTLEQESSISLAK